MFPFVLLFQWTIPNIEQKRNIHLNFSDITFEKCNDPEHSHPPLSQRDTPEEPEKLVNSDINNPVIVNSSNKYFDIKAEIIFKIFERSPESLFKHFTPARSPPFFEV